MYCWKSSAYRLYKGFTILEFLVVMVLSGTVATTSFFLMRNIGEIIGKKVLYEATITDIEAFKHVLQRDIFQTKEVSVDGFGNLSLALNDQHVVYALSSSDLFRNSASITANYGIEVQYMELYFESEKVDRESLVDCGLISFTDAFSAEHKISFRKEYGKADLYQYFIDQGALNERN